ncbi:MAG: acyltransferase [Vibrionaceae bacterium]
MLKLRNCCKIDPDNRLTIGKKTRIRHCTINIRGQNNQLIIEEGANLRRVHLEIEGDGCTIRIGKHSVIGENCYLSAKESGVTLSIGQNCMFSRNIKIMTSDGHSIVDKNSLQRINPAKDVTIGDNVWLADNVVVLKGSQVGDASVIGINSVVTQSIAPHCIASGSPATVKKTDIIWQP